MCNGFTGAAVEHEQLPALGALNQRGHFALRRIEINQRGLCGHIIVPDIAVDGLERPARPSGGDVERDNRAGIACLVVVFEAAEEIGRGIAHPDISEAERVISAGDAPGIGGAARMDHARSSGR